MSKPILTPDEINALMGESVDPISIEETLTSYFEPLLSLIRMQFTRLFGTNVNLDNFYIEELSSLDKLADQEKFITPVQLSFGEILIIISAADGELLSKFLGVQIEKAVTLFAEESGVTIGEFFSDQFNRLVTSTTQQSALMNREQIGALPVSLPSYLVSLHLSFKNYDLQFKMLFPHQTYQALLKNMEQNFSGKPAAFSSKSFASFETFEFAEIKQGIVQAETDGLTDIDNLVDDVTVELSASLGSAVMTLGELMKLKEGDIVILDKVAGDLADVFLNEQSIARAEVTVLDENFGLRIVDIVPAAQRINS